MPEVVAKDVTGGAIAPKAEPVQQPQEQATQTPVVQEQKPDPKMEALIKRERMLRAKQREIQQRERELEAKLAPPPPNPDEIHKQWKDRLKTDLLGTLQQEGYSLEQIAQTLLSANPQDLGIQDLRRQNDALKQEMESIKKSLNEGQENSVKQALNQIGADTRQLIRQNPEEYETLAKAGDQGIEAVKMLIHDVYKKEGYIMDLEEAAQDVENYMLEQALEYTKLKKIQSKLTPTQQAQQGVTVAAPKPKPPPVTTPRTLNRQIVQAQTKPLTQKERRERAIAAFMGKPINT